MQTNITSRNDLVCINRWISNIEDLSDSSHKRIRVKFYNGYQLSIVQGLSTYRNMGGLFEIALFNKKGQMDGSLFDQEDQGDDVLGFCSVEKINYYAKKIGSLP